MVIKNRPKIPKNIERIKINKMYPGIETWWTQKMVIPKKMRPQIKERDVASFFVHFSKKKRYKRNVCQKLKI